VIVPKIKFNARKTIDLGAPRNSRPKAMSYYYPSTNTIELNLLLSWKGMIAIFFHELVHWYQWHFIYKRNVKQWNNNKENQEKMANKVQDFIYHILLRSK